jgi:hypothetical protein
MKVSIVTAALAAVALFAGSAARADDEVTILPLEDAVQKLANGSPFLVLSAKEGSDEEKAFKAAFADKKLAKVAKDVLAVRIDPNDAEAAQKVGLAPAKACRVEVLDGYGLSAGSRDAKPTSDIIANLLKQAEDTTKKKKKFEKVMEALVAKGEASLKIGDDKGACEHSVKEEAKTLKAELSAKEAEQK